MIIESLIGPKIPKSGNLQLKFLQLLQAAMGGAIEYSTWLLLTGRHTGYSMGFLWESSPGLCLLAGQVG